MILVASYQNVNIQSEKSFNVYTAPENEMMNL